ncbi:TetR family transcriptional regulator [Microbacterium sp.]|uniref:TetR/AcrR family transcriptional regulator n=1 Tax=Microbacterium sp. TaxID=51671 RepID=UPI00289F6C88|nr:TetR family transcriptional regulator [Microbacterium sp.]
MLRISLCEDGRVIAKQTRAERVAQTKETIRAAAAKLFREDGFPATGVRDIAHAAEVDPATVIRYFGSKEGLFLETMELPAGIDHALAGPLDSLAADYLRFILDERAHADGRAILAALVRASDRAEVASALRIHTQAVFEERLLPRLSGPDALLRAHLFAAGMTGLQVALWVSEDDVLVTASTEALIAAYSPSLQLILTP